jgi:hypothetical protein
MLGWLGRESTGAAFALIRVTLILRASSAYGFAP